ncbi:ParB/RepB/Spo0J family partition protein [Streptomyces sp. HMX87]|uniref:ParB/RepB/Spo0J family partition protein n=1 Tax=Streptomyces sp. HMX87 TaxID=3390849 RepID=UPI003A84AC7E
MNQPAEPADAHILAAVAPEVHRVSIASLVLTGSPRRDTEDAQHIQLLCHNDGDLPPIVVHLSTLRVIDGRHRVQAYKLLGRRHVAARYFDGSEEDAFVLSVRLNARHGLPLCLAERRAAAVRILRTHPQWSDRGIAAVVGLSPKTVGRLRGCSSEESAQSNTRLGRDGRARPLRAGDARIRASAVIAARPEASIRQIAREAGVSVGTAHSVRALMEAGAPLAPDDVEEADAVAGRYRALSQDPGLRYTERGRMLLRWLDAHLVLDEEWRIVAEGLPPHWAEVAAGLARRCAAEWLALSRELNRHGPGVHDMRQQQAADSYALSQ